MDIMIHVVKMNLLIQRGQTKKDSDLQLLDHTKDAKKLLVKFVIKFVKLVHLQLNVLYVLKAELTHQNVTVQKVNILMLTKSVNLVITNVQNVIQKTYVLNVLSILIDQTLQNVNVKMVIMIMVLLNVLNVLINVKHAKNIKINVLNVLPTTS